MRGWMSCAVVCALWVAAAGVASADLIAADLLSSGDGLITRDTGTGLEWLDLTETTNLSVASVQAGAGGWYALGFTHATTTQVSELFLHSASGATLNALQPGSNYIGASALRGLMGTLSNGYGGGYTADGPSAGMYYRPLYEARTDIPWGILASPGPALDGSAGWAIGHFLVRSTIPVPEPGTLVLLGLGAAGLGAAGLTRRSGRRRKT